MKSIIVYLILFLANAYTDSTFITTTESIEKNEFKKTYAMIRGVVVDQKTQLGLPGVNISVKDTRKGTSSNAKGEFTISKVDPGKYTLILHHIGYARKTYEVTVAANSTVDIGIIAMNEEPTPLKTVVVTPGSYSIMESDPSVRQTLSSEDIKIMGWAEDITRAIQRVPGITGNDFTAKFNVRGGDEDEVLVLLDGMQVYEPFHQKDFGGGLFSTVDIETIGGLSLLTGGYTAEYGDKMSGVLDMKTKQATEGEIQNSIGISLMNARAFSMGAFNDGKGSWLVSGRRGFLDLLNKLTTNEFKLHPSYYDAMGKVAYQVRQNQTFSAHLFVASDAYKLDENVIETGKTVPNIDFLDTRYGNYYNWYKLESFFKPELHVRTIVYGGIITKRRDRYLFDDDPEAHLNSNTVNDDRNFKLVGFKQDWSYEASDNLFLKFGLDIKRLHTKFTYSKEVNNEFVTVDRELTNQTEELAVRRTVTGTQVGLYVSNRLQILQPLTLETGLRYDYAGYSGDHLWSPRLALVYSLSKSTFIRAGWGYYYQPQIIDELNIQFGETDYNPAELSKHTVLGIEHHFNNGLQLRAEGYYKRISDLQDDYITFRNIDEFLPETRDDLIKLVIDNATTKGIELYAKYDAGKKVSAWFSYVLSDATDNVSDLQFAGPLVHRTGEIPRSWNQRHTINADLNYRPSRQWEFNFAWQYHSGWPYTPFEVQRIARDDGTFAYYHDYGVYNSKTYPAYHRLDVRTNKHFYTSGGKITAFLHIINTLNHQNVNNFDYSILEQDANTFSAEIDTETWFGILPFVGVSWEF